MGLEVRPFNDACNIRCTYCYQENSRSSGNVVKKYDLDKIKSAIIREREPFTLFGGEPLLMPITDLEDLWSMGYERFGSNSIQTNAILINAEHIRLFKQYDVSVGVSIDGPAELNNARWSKNLEHTRTLTLKAEAAIAEVVKEGIPVSIIITIHRKNAVGYRLEKLMGWVTEMYGKGIKVFRVHTLEVNNESVRHDIGLTESENLNAILSFAKLKKTLPGLHIDLLDEMEQLLQQNDEYASCVWYSCDPYTTPAVTGINGNGQYSNCGRTNKDGVDVVKSEKHGYERQVALYLTPQSAGGCLGCRFFLMCKGYCPGTSAGYDWRNRTEDCSLLKQLFAILEKNLLDKNIKPLSLHPLRQQMEHEFINNLMGSIHLPLSYLDGIEKNTTPDWNGMPDFLRLSWSGNLARDIWEERIKKINAALPIIFAGSVNKNILQKVVISVVPWQYFDLLSHYGDSDVVIKANENIRKGTSDKLTVTICKKNNPDTNSGTSMYGCCKHQQEIKVSVPGFHSVLQPGCNKKEVVVTPHWKANRLLSDLQLSILPYTPCSENCEHGNQLAEDIYSLGESMFPDEMNWLKELLNCPVKYSLLHGILEVKTPLFKYITKSIFTNDKYDFIYNGVSEPEGAPYGKKFPYKMKKSVTV